MTIPFARLQEYLDLIVTKAGDDVTNAPHGRFWSSYQSLTGTLPILKCQGQDIYPVKFLDAAKTQVDADNSPLFVILTNGNGFCGREQMPPGGPFVNDPGYSLTLSDRTVVQGTQVVQDIHDWLAVGAPNN
jgi:hypothetical protein